MITLTFEEMLPSSDQLWLRDEHGRYTFELRMQASRDESTATTAAPRW